LLDKFTFEFKEI